MVLCPSHAEKLDKVLRGLHANGAPKVGSLIPGYKPYSSVRFGGHGEQRVSNLKGCPLALTKITSWMLM